MLPKRSLKPGSKVKTVSASCVHARARYACVVGSDGTGFDWVGWKLPDVPAWPGFTQADLDSWMDAAEGTVPPEQPRPSDT